MRNEGNRVGALRVRVVCAPATRKAGEFDLAQIGANARRATEDSTTIAYIGELEPGAVRFSAPILEEAGVAQFPETPGPQAIQKLLPAIEQALEDDTSIRESVYNQLE